MKKSKKPLIGAILIGVGIIGAFGIPSSESKAALIFGVIALITAGVILLLIGIKQNKRINEEATSKSPVPTSSPVSADVDGSKSVDMLPSHQNDMIKVYQYTEKLCVISGEKDPLPYIQDKANKGIRQIEFEFEPDNQFDSLAVAIKLDGVKIGYVFRGQTQDMIHDFYHGGHEIAGHINTFAPGDITYKIAFYKPKAKCRINEVSCKSKRFVENTYAGEMLDVEYEKFEDHFITHIDGEEFVLPKKVAEYANKYFDVPAEVGENCESLIFYK